VCISLINIPVSLKYEKQHIIAKSTAEAKYKTLVDDTTKILWLCLLLSEMLPSTSMTTLWCNNLGATFLSVNHVFHAYYKHVELNYHFVCDQVAKKKIQVRFISSNDLLVDVLTKPLPSASFAHFRSKLRVKSLSSA
jgi:hypothetical protein